MWQSAHRVIRFNSSSSPCWLRSCLWWTCRFCLEPQSWRLQLSRRRICFLIDRMVPAQAANGRLGRICFRKLSRSVSHGSESPSRQFLLHLPLDPSAPCAARLHNRTPCPSSLGTFANSSPFVHPTSFNSFLACGGRCSWIDME